MVANTGLTAVQTSFAQHITLLTQDKVRVEKFLEHLELAKILSDDVRITTFIEHTIEEETEHLAKVTKLLAQAEALGSMPAEPSPSPAPAYEDNAQVFPHPLGGAGHVRRRDDHALTVGSLYGLRQ
jgi:hypothetical protein